VSISWTAFAALVLAGFFVVNLLFATFYYYQGMNSLKGADVSGAVNYFWSAFFFSAQTLTTVGYGTLSPVGWLTNMVASIEAMLGLMGFAVATGLLVGRVARPSARIVYSDKCLVTPYEDITSLQFRVANKRRNNIMQLTTTVILMLVDECSNGLRRDFFELSLTRANVLFFPVTWTLVHPIDKDSPLFGKTAKDLERLQAEVLILIKGFDDTFGQEVHSRYSYTYDEIQWGGKFVQAFHVDPEGNMVLNVARVSEIKDADEEPTRIAAGAD
jgi:inward rectifier potassium channel